MKWTRWFAVILACATMAAQAAGRTPTLFLAGDSTMRTTRAKHAGWGDALAPWLPRGILNVENCARGGASTRSFRDEGTWAKLLAALKPGDVVILQFGHNDQGSPRDGKATLDGVDGRTKEYQDKLGRPVVVHTYGWYLGRCIDEVLARGALPVLATPVPRNLWIADKVGRVNQPHPEWVRQMAKQRGVPLLDLHRIVSEHYEQVGVDMVRRRYFRKGDESHTTPEGAAVTAKLAADALRGHPDARLREIFGKAVDGG